MDFACVREDSIDPHVRTRTLDICKDDWTVRVGGGGKKGQRGNCKQQVHGTSVKTGCG